MLKITEELRDNLIKYLATRPYNEVVQGIQALATLEEIKDKKDVKTNPTN